MNENRILDIFPTLFKNQSHRDWLYGVAQMFRAHTGVTENARDRYEHLREENTTEYHFGELIEMATIMSLFSENPMVCYTDRNGQVRLLCGSA